MIDYDALIDGFSILIREHRLLQDAKGRNLTDRERLCYIGGVNDMAEELLSLMEVDTQ